MEWDDDKKDAQANLHIMDETISYLVATQNHIHENIKFADQKAAVFLTINSALLGTLYGNREALLPSGNCTVTQFSVLTFVLLLLSILLAALVLFPRGVKMHREVEGEILLFLRRSASSRWPLLPPPFRARIRRRFTKRS